MSGDRTGGEILVANLLAQGATHAFCVPGESYLAVLDALHDVRDRLQLIVCRQEGGVAYMAEASGKDHVQVVVMPQGNTLTIRIDAEQGVLQLLGGIFKQAATAGLPLGP